MKRIKLFIIYFPVTLVTLQVIVNIWALIDRNTYNAAGFYLTTFIGTNILFALFLLAFTWWSRLCAISRWAAIAECLFALNYLIVKQDNLYNILFQVIVGVISLIITFRHFIKKFPLCDISLFCKLIGFAVLAGSCSKGLDKWEREIKSTLKQTYHNAANSLRYR